jgi:hypothetical protein
MVAETHFAACMSMGLNGLSYVLNCGLSCSLERGTGTAFVIGRHGHVLFALLVEVGPML